ncbi:MAG: TonB-dependent receptor, partial [Chitinophagaceae bacterium]
MKRKIFIAAAVCFSSQLHAQQPVPTNSGDSAVMDAVVVTATKEATRQSQTGKVISVITRAELEKKGGRTLSQVLNEQAGVTINGALNSPGNPQTIFTRGGSAGRTLVLMDGVPVYDPSLINSEFDLNLLLVSDIERIEICRGAQSTLYGSDAVAGVINIITQQNYNDKPVNAKATFTAGSFNTFRSNAQVSGKLGKLSYNTRLAHLTTKGFSSAYDSSGKSNFDKDGYKGTLLNASLQYQLSKELQLTGFIQNSRYKNDVDAGIFTDEKDHSISNKSLMTGAGIRFNTDFISLTGNYQYSKGNRKYFNDSIDVPGFTTFSRDEYFYATQFAELYATIKLGKNFSLLQGGDYRNGSMNNSYESVSGFGPYNSFFKDTAVSQASIYAALFYKSSNTRFNLELGGRINVHSRYGNNQTYTFNPSYALGKGARIFGSIATAFKAPSLYQLYSSSGSRDLQPETSVNYEAGAELKRAKM